MMTIDVTRLKIFAEELLTKGGFAADEAKAIAYSLVLSELMGHGSHGIMRVKEYLKDIKKGTVKHRPLRPIQTMPTI